MFAAICRRWCELCNYVIWLGLVGGIVAMFVDLAMSGRK